MLNAEVRCQLQRSVFSVQYSLFKLDLFSKVQSHHILYMNRLRKHVHRLDGCDLVHLRQDFQIPGLRGRVATYIHHGWRCNIQYLFHQFFVHACPWWIGNNYIGPAMQGKKSIIANRCYIAGKKMGVFYIIQRGIFSGIINRFFN